jgi:hypothetical protein
MYKPHRHCRACGYGPALLPQDIKADQREQLQPVFDLGLQPLANDFRRPDAERAGYAPLQVLLCPRCSLAQLSVVVDPRILYSNYPYITSRSRQMAEHFKEILHDLLVEEIPEGRVVEIGSNDGLLLEFLSEQGFGPLTGIDPAFDPFPKKGNRINSIRDFFGSESAHIALAGGSPAVILARHVFCHIDDWRAFMSALAILAGPQTIIGIETPWLVDLLAQTELDTVYHEHLSYLSLRAMVELLRGTPFHLHRIVRHAIHGGVLMLWLRHNEHPSTPDASVDQMLAREIITATDWLAFTGRAQEHIMQLRRLVHELVDAGKSVAGLCASAKSTVWITACGFTRKEIRFLADSTPQKQYTLSPGTDIPIVDEGALLRESPDYTVMFGWNYREELLRRNDTYRAAGGKFIVPVPDVEIIP